MCGTNTPWHQRRCPCATNIVRRVVVSIQVKPTRRTPKAPFAQRQRLLPFTARTALGGALPTVDLDQDLAEQPSNVLDDVEERVDLLSYHSPRTNSQTPHASGTAATTPPSTESGHGRSAGTDAPLRFRAVAQPAPSICMYWSIIHSVYPMVPYSECYLLCKQTYSSGDPIGFPLSGRPKILISTEQHLSRRL